MFDTINRIRKAIDCKKRRYKCHKMTLGARTFLTPEEHAELAACHAKESKLAKESRLTVAYCCGVGLYCIIIMHSWGTIITLTTNKQD